MASLPYLIMVEVSPGDEKGLQDVYQKFGPVFFAGALCGLLTGLGIGALIESHFKVSIEGFGAIIFNSMFMVLGAAFYPTVFYYLGLVN